MRYALPETGEALRQLLSALLPDATAELLDAKSVRTRWRVLSQQDTTTKQPKLLSDGATLTAFVYGGRAKLPRAAVGLQFQRLPTKDEIHFVQQYVRLFNDDLRRCSSHEDEELWEVIRSSRFQRTVSRFLQFRPARLLSWLTAMESSMALTYEGEPNHLGLVIVRKFSRARATLGEAFIPFDIPIRIEEALQQKWIRALVDGRRVLLLASWHTGEVRGLISLSELEAGTPRPRFAPHESLLSIQALLNSSDVAFLASPHGDLFVLRGTGVAFQRTQGQWSLVDYEATQRHLVPALGDELATQLLRAVLDLSYERVGALLCVVDARDLDKIVTPSKPGGANERLRTSLRGANICVWAQRQVVTAAAAIDGAIVMDTTGRVLDVACTIHEPPAEELQRLGVSRPAGLVGHRAAAAWAASCYGIAIKVSDDGPITVYRGGAARPISSLG